MALWPAFLGVALPGSFNVINENRPSQKDIFFFQSLLFVCAMFVSFQVGHLTSHKSLDTYLQWQVKV